MKASTISCVFGIWLTLIFLSPAQAQSVREQFQQHLVAGDKLQDAGRSAEALKHFQAATELARQIPEAQRMDVLHYLHYETGKALEGCGRLKEAFEEMQAVEAWRRKNLGNDDPATMQVIKWLTSYYEKTKHEQAMPYAWELLHLSEKKYGDDSLEVAECLLRCVYASTGRVHPKEAERAATRCVEIYQARLGPRAHSLEQPLNMLFKFALDQGEFRRAEQIMQRRESLEPEKTDDPLKQIQQKVLNALGRTLFYRTTGRLLEAEAMDLQALHFSLERDKLLQAKGISYVGTANIRVTLADLYLEMGLLSKAEEQYRLAYARFKQIKDVPNNMAGAWALNGLGQVYQRQGKLKEADRSFQESFELGKGLALDLRGAHYGRLVRDLGRYDEAAEILATDAESDIATNGEKSPSLPQTRLDQGDIEVARGRREAAEKFYQQVIDADVPLAGDRVVAQARMGMARLAAAHGEGTKAVEAADKARRELRRYTQRILPALAEHEQLEFLADQEARSLEDALAIAWQFRGDRGAREAGAAWTLNAKGMAQEAIAQRTLVARGTSDPRLAAVLREWLAVRYRLAKLALTIEKGTDASQREREVAALTAREQTLAAHLGRSSVQDESASSWIELSAVREKIPADAVLVEIVRRAPPRPVTRLPGRADVPAVPHYLAWVIPPAGPGEVKLVDLGPCDELDAAVVKARKPLLEAREAILEVGEAEAEKALRGELALLSQKLLEPLRPHVAGYRNWIVSPDGSLWLVPWAALLVEKDKYLVESHVTRLVVSGRDLVELANRKASGNPGLVLADPDYDLRDEGSKAPPGESVDDRRTEAARSAAVRSAVSSSWQRLPGTAQEARALEPSLAAYTGSSIEMRTGRDAAETVVRDAWQPRVAVLSTHGYFLDRANDSDPLRSPLLRCGLVLAGANRRSAAASESSDDGILTGLEIVGADLRGTELVVLSACETALGEVRAAEGVAGLRQAFQLAGAQSVLASLWRVPDADTATLMVDFYDRLAKTGDKADSLAQAQLALLTRHRKENSGAGHPYFWAAFTLTGRTDRPEVNPPQKRPVRLVVRPRVQVVSASAPIMDGSKQVATARKGEFLEVAGEKGEWILVALAARAQPAWIERRHVQQVKGE